MKKTEKIIDWRSDTVTKPSKDMLKAILNANVGDDVFGEDPTVNALEEKLAHMTGMEAAVFAPTGTQSNLMSLMAHCQRGDEYIVGQTAHTYRLEGGGAAVLGSVQPQPMDFSEDGTLNLDKVAALIKPMDDYHARTKLLCLENTVNGKVLPLEYLNTLPSFCKKYHISSHLDGARVFNSAVKLSVPLNAITQNFDSVSICLSKGLGTPMGSVLCGSSKFIKEARHWRKMLGGGMRQIGFMAAAGLYALENNIARLSKDHDNAAILANALNEIDEIELISVNTNIIFIGLSDEHLDLSDYLATHGIKIPSNIREVKYSNSANKKNIVRLVTHLNITQADVYFTIQTIKDFLSSTGNFYKKS